MANIWTSSIIINPAQDKNQSPKEDPTNCSHSWELMTGGSLMVAGMIDHRCSVCKAHGWRRKGEGDAEIEYCCGGVQQNAK